MIVSRRLYGPGGYLPGTPNAPGVPGAIPPGNVVEVGTRILPGLGANRTTLPADGSAAATLHYAQEQPGDAAWLVNGTPYAEPLAQDAASGLWWSEIEVTASAPGPVEIACNDATLTLEAE